MKQRLHLFLLSAVLACLGSCIKKDKFPVIPELEYKDFILTGSLSDIKGELVFNFTDGDGDIGLKPEDTVPPFHKEGDHYHNFFMDYYVKENGEFRKLEPPVPYFYRLPFIEPEGKNKTLQGTISVTSITPFPRSLNFDTVRFHFYMEDRKFNRSNVVITPEIIRPQ